ncbi:MAG: hypothetical protein EBT86_00565 [Actinobacteria bacterium]|nr:hypothetical protein [Actinomycetota bacterium]
MAKLELKDILSALDQNGKDIWDLLDDEQKKAIPFFVLNRFMSSVKTNSREVQEHYVLATNEYYNKHYFSLYQHPKLLWLLLCSCSYDNDKTYFHEYIRLEKDKNVKLKILEKLYPKKKIDDLETLSHLNSLKEIMELAKDHGWNDKEIQEYL